MSCGSTLSSFNSNHRFHITSACCVLALTQIHHHIHVAVAAHRASGVKRVAQETPVLVMNVEHAWRGRGMMKGAEGCAGGKQRSLGLSHLDW